MVSPELKAFSILKYIFRVQIIGGCILLFVLIIGPIQGIAIRTAHIGMYRKELLKYLTTQPVKERENGISKSAYWMTPSEMADYPINLSKRVSEGFELATLLCLLHIGVGISGVVCLRRIQRHRKL
jgi:hypothetical protein